MEDMSKLEMWMHFLNRDDDEALKYAIDNNPAIKEAEERYQELLRNPECIEECIVGDFEELNGNYGNINAVYIIADTHFNHENIIKYCDRPFKNVKEMNDYIINKWNSVVKRNDLVIHLGDFGFGSEEMLRDINSSLNGFKILIKGNHDFRRSDNSWRRIGFRSVQNEKCEYGKFVFSHYPEEIPKDYYNIFGHIHNKSLDDKISHSNHICVSCEVINYTPVRLKDVLKIHND